MTLGKVFIFLDALSFNNFGFVVKSEVKGKAFILHLLDIFCYVWGLPNAYKIGHKIKFCLLFGIQSWNNLLVKCLVKTM